MKPYFVPGSYQMVYQGGHHDVYCDGSTHIWTRGGGTTNMTRPRFHRAGPCDCYKYGGASTSRFFSTVEALITEARKQGAVAVMPNTLVRLLTYARVGAVHLDAVVPPAQGEKKD
jgi:hypothetical protein